MPSPGAHRAPGTVPGTERRWRTRQVEFLCSRSLPSDSGETDVEKNSHETTMPSFHEFLQEEQRAEGV